MSDINYINAYNEVVLENFISVLKQNFMFQTQIKFFEERVSVIPALEEKGNLYDLVVIENVDLKNKLISSQSEIESKDIIIKNSLNVDTDKHRLQTALNIQAKELEQLNIKIVDIEKNCNIQKEYIKQLEDMLPNSKRKKLGLELIEFSKDEFGETTLSNNNTLKFESTGGTF